MIRRFFLATLLCFGLVSPALPVGLGLGLDIPDIAAKSPALIVPTSGGLVSGFPIFTGWTTTQATLTANVGTSPSGAGNATSITDTSAFGGHTAASPTFTITSGGTYTVEAFIKVGSSGTPNLDMGLTDNVTNNFTAEFNPSTGAFLGAFNVGAGTISATGFTAYPNGWFKVWATGAVNGGSTTVSAFIGFHGSYTGNGVENIWLWGESVTAGSTPP